MSKRQKTLDSFLKVNRGDSIPKTLVQPCGESPCSVDQPLPESSLQVPSTDKWDIAHVLESILTNQEKLQWLRQLWVPPAEYKFPICEDLKKHRRSFQRQWLLEYKWLCYSQQLEGGFCKACVFFGKKNQRNEKKLGALVNEPFKNYKKAIEHFKKHSGLQYHQTSEVAMQCFLDSMEGRTSDVASLLDSQKKKCIEENRLKIIPIIKTIILCGRQNFALRGHRDDGVLDTNNHCKEGNFRALLKYRVDAGDQVLEKHIMSAKGNASYISKTTQNDLINSCHAVLTKKIVMAVKEAKYFTLVADETTDMAITEQLALCIRYLDPKTTSIQERFLSFIKVNDLCGKTLANAITNEMKNLNIDILNCRGQAYDGAANMSGCKNGVQAHIARIQPLAMYTHCSSHRLNLALSDASTVTSIRNAMGVVSSASSYLRDSAQRLELLQNEAGDHLHKIKKLCATRWVERHTAVLHFLEILPFLPNVLEKLNEKESSCKPGITAFSLLSSIRTSEFIVSLIVMNKLLGITLPLARQLQKKTIDVLQARELIDAVKLAMSNLRKNSDHEFKELFMTAQDTATKVGIEIVAPRVTSIQKDRFNAQVASCEEYFRVSVWLPFLDYIIAELSRRFQNEDLQRTECLMQLMPQNIIVLEPEGFKKVVECAKQYSCDISVCALEGEMSVWKALWLAKGEVPKSIVDALKSAECVPNIKTLLAILAILPITSCTAERSFSALRRIKDYLRGTIGQDRLNGIALLNIEQDIEVLPGEVLDEYCARHSRKLQFQL